jgi:hypothetical protein
MDKRFWSMCIRRAWQRSSPFANDWQWMFGVPFWQWASSTSAFAGLTGYLVSNGHGSMSTGYPVLDGVIAAAAVFGVTWVVGFVLNIFGSASNLYYEEKNRADALQASIEAERLILILAINAPRIQQCRRGDFVKVPIEFAGWMFECPATITNRSAKSKLSLDISLRIKMKPPFPREEFILNDADKRLWQYQEQLRSPLSLGPQESVRGTFYFWTGPMMDEKICERLSDLIETENYRPIANLDIKNLITDEVLSVKIPTI